MSRKLYRSTEHKIIGGVCGGLGDHFDIDPTWLRIGFVVLVAATKGVGLLLYVIAWVIIPKQKPDDLVEVSTGTDAKSSTKPGRSEFNTSYLPGIILIGLGVMFLLYESFWWFDFHLVWPVVLIIIGGVLLYRSIESKNAAEHEQEQEVVNESR
ncbi:PspC domain-containing protein [Candidatus Zixiibacteriota bacterium]